MKELINIPVDVTAGSHADGGTIEFDHSPLDDVGELELTDTIRAATREDFEFKGMRLSLCKLPFMPFEDQEWVGRKLKEAFRCNLLQLIMGSSGCGKTTGLLLSAKTYPNYTYYTDKFSETSPAQMISLMSKLVGAGDMKLRTSQLTKLQDHLKSIHTVMFVFDEVVADKPFHRQKLDLLRKINGECGTPIVICGQRKLYNDLYDEKNYDALASLISRLHEHEMKGMNYADAENYLKMLEKTENVEFSRIARNALVKTALTQRVGCLHAFSTVLSKCLTYRRRLYNVGDVLQHRD